LLGEGLGGHGGMMEVVACAFVGCCCSDGRRTINVGCCCPNGQRTLALHEVKHDRAAWALGDLLASIWAALVASAQHLGAPRPERAPRVCADTHLDPAAKGFAPGPHWCAARSRPPAEERFALSCVARPWIVGGATSLRVAHEVSSCLNVLASTPHSPIPLLPYSPIPLLHDIFCSLRPSYPHLQSPTRLSDRSIPRVWFDSFAGSILGFRSGCIVAVAGLFAGVYG
jgi:hypothetical protein